MDFTHTAYKRYLRALKSSHQNIIRFDEFFVRKPMPSSFCLIRHDVDRKPKNALAMAELEAKLGIKATYYFRAKPRVFLPDIIRAIAGLGHEIGYHYECLSDAKGDIVMALKNFEDNLKRFREIVNVRTIAMHGRPLKPFDNLAMWRHQDNHKMLGGKYGILGEVYLDIDYQDVAYISDTGRNWSLGKANLRDRVDSDIALNFKSGDELYDYLKVSPHPCLVFQTHPERWTNSLFEHSLSWGFDLMANSAKYLVRLFRATR